VFGVGIIRVLLFFELYNRFAGFCGFCSFVEISGFCGNFGVFWCILRCFSVFLVLFEVFFRKL